MPTQDPRFKPLHVTKDHEVAKRKLHKILQKSGWYSESEIFSKSKWRSRVPKGWSGCKPFQYSVPGMRYSTIMHVPSSGDGRLVKMLAKAEPRIAKITGYQMKFVEKSGRRLLNLFSISSEKNALEVTALSSLILTLSCRQNVRQKVLCT